MSEPTPGQALVERILAGGAPLVLRQAAARGALPLPRPALARLWVHLLGDPEEAIRVAAGTSLDGLGSEGVEELLTDAACDSEVLRHYAAQAVRDPALAERIAFHPAVPDDALMRLASEGSASVVDLVLTNQEKLLASPALLDRLATNPALRPDQRGRLLDLLDNLSRRGAVAEAEPEAGVAEPVDPEEAARLLEVDPGELFAASEIAGGEEFEEAEDPRIRSVYRHVLMLSAAQKAMLAMKGGREERMILVRDTNKVVALSVLKNPRLMEADVEEIAMMRNVSDEVLRAVGASREWSRRYSVAAALVRNPKTPPGISLNFVSRLTAKDLKLLAKDKNVPEIVRRVAKRTHEQRTQKTAPGFKKK